MHVVFMSFFGALLAVGADFLIKNGHLWCGALLYAGCAWPAYWCFRYSEFGYVTIVWSASAVIVGVLVGRCVFHEQITVLRVVGLIAAVVAVMLTK